MKNLIKRIEAKISDLEKLVKLNKLIGNMDACIKYSSQQTGLYTALEFALEEQGKEISGE